MWEREQIWGIIDFHSTFFPTMEVNGAQNRPGYKLSSKISFLCVQQNKEIHTGLELLEGE